MALLDDFKARRPQLRDVDYFHTAIVLSVVLHLSIALIWALNQQFKFLHPDLFKFLEKIDPTRVLVQNQKQPAKIVVDQRIKRMIQLKLAEVDPNQASVVVPRQAQYYGAQDTVAANENPTEKDTGKARIEGDQARLVRVKDVARSSKDDKSAPPRNQRPVEEPQPKPVIKPMKPPPKPRPVAKTTKPATETESGKQEPSQPPSPKVVRVAKVNLPMAAPPEPEAKPKTDPEPPKPEPAPLVPSPPEPAKRPRPRTLEEARQREAERLKLLGKQMRQEGGVRRKGGPSLSVRGTSFGAYDTRMFGLIQHAWDLAMEGRVIPAGKVVINYRLLPDGRVTKLEIAETSVDGFFTTICQMAVNGPKFDRWPQEMRRQMGQDYRDLKLTFYYD